MKKNVLIIGATSGIGRRLAMEYAGQGCRVAILGRREEKLKEIALTAPDTFIPCMCDITDTAHAPLRLDEVYATLHPLDLVLIAAGTGELNPELQYRLEEPTIATNVAGWSCVADWCMNTFERQGYGHLAVITSVGGLRGSRTAPAYNASKAYQMNYIEGLRARTAHQKAKIRITDIRPGLVDTAMAKGEGLFWVIPVEKAGRRIYQAIEKGRKVAYITRRWRLVALVLQLLPSCLYHKM